MPDLSGLMPEGQDVLDFLDAPDPDYNWLIPGLMERGERLIITGREGKGKSTLMRQIALQCAAGVHPFTLEAMEPMRVMFVDLENPPSTVRRELRKWAEVRRPERGMLKVHCWPGGIDLSELGQQALFQQRLATFRPDLLIIGPMYKLAPKLTDEDASAALASFFDGIRMLVNLTLMMESHQPHENFVDGKSFRPERPIGSSLWMRWPEFGFCLEDSGLLRAWRGARDADRMWPSKLERGGIWPWTVDTTENGGMCLNCLRDLTGAQEKYCSEKCASAARQREYRARKRGAA